MATDYYPTSTDPPPATAAERDAMVRLAERWETEADDLALAAEPAGEIGTLLKCADELRSALAGRPGAQSAGPVPDADPLRHIEVGDPAPLFDGPYCGMGWCTRRPHPEHWQHIVGDDGRVLAVWTDEPQPGADS